VHPHDARIGAQQSGDDFQDRRFPGAARPENDLRMAFDEREADRVEHHVVVERQVHLVEHDDGRAGFVQQLFEGRSMRCAVLHRGYSSEMRICVTKKSAAITATDPATTDTVVALPTPCVPPVVRSPTWQAMVTIRKPNTTGLMSPIQMSCMYRPFSTDDQYRPLATCSRTVATTHPPTMPTKSATMVRMGAMKKPDSRRGTTSLRTGSVPSARSALIWSVTTIDPSSAAMP